MRIVFHGCSTGGGFNAKASAYTVAYQSQNKLIVEPWNKKMFHGMEKP